ncbi:hypothetical protein DPMN_107095 [Dreissena polymorpha]|uniref:Uncharacterized protein n=2 Tax=Dreissena polymorpha TaxID=45954 RepID=A0A9D4K6F8_DREPO|nr:hypothetical protein DPMN_107095 [Dreissena polymorpha]
MTRTSSRPVLSQLKGTLNVSSSDEFEKPRLLRKSVSAGAMGSKTSKSDLRVETEEDLVGDMLDNITKKKRKLGNPQKGFFGEMKPE